MCIFRQQTLIVFFFFLYMFKVCLDHTATTEKELDTVEVLKAIQKAKEAKDRMANSDKKVRGWAQEGRARAAYCLLLHCFVLAQSLPVKISNRCVFA